MTARRCNQLPKTFSDALARRLNGACKGGDGCGLECAGIGWCGRCWAAAAKTRGNRSENRSGSPL